MGYTTDFEGQFEITPALTPEQTAYLHAFSATRRMNRITLHLPPDPLREAVGLPEGPEGAYWVGAQWPLPEHGEVQHYDGNKRQMPYIESLRYRKEEPPSHGGSALWVRDYNRPPNGQPGLWCQWKPTADGTALQWDGGEKFYNYVEWLQYIVQHFLTPWGRKLNGEVKWYGEDRDDRGVIYVKDNQIEAVDAECSAPRPSWER